MRRWLLGGALTLAACAGPQRFSAPAPDGALDCAFREAQHLGYQAVEGSVEDGMVLVGRRIAPRPEIAVRDRPGEEGKVVTTDYSQIPWDGQLRLRQGDGRLRIEVISERNLNGQPPGTVTTADDGRQLLALCSSPGPT
jgi:hypothetical protein